jgi:NosR/NirI family transcriptional regulator, nitrous oxide reductase regulator
LPGIVTLAAQTKRIFTNPRPEPHFKTLFPNAGGFSSFGGTPLHWKVYGADPKTNSAAPSASALANAGELRRDKPIGYIFWTTDLVPNERAYHGPIHMLVGMDTHGILQGVVVDYNSEPYGYFSIDPPEFVARLKGKSVRDPFVVGKDIQAVSRASITMNGAARALRDSSRAVAKAFLSPDQVK